MTLDVFLQFSLSVLDGGEYYNLADVPKTKAEFLKSIGANEGLSEELLAARRAGMIESQVTGKPRVVQITNSLLGDLWTTFDIADNKVGVKNHPIYSLGDFIHDAEEIIWTRSNGMFGYVLFSADGIRQDDVPPEIAHDHTRPAPHTSRLESAISCIACHGYHPGS